MFVYLFFITNDMIKLAKKNKGNAAIAQDLADIYKAKKKDGLVEELIEWTKLSSHKRKDGGMSPSVGSIAKMIEIMNCFIPCIIINF